MGLDLTEAVSTYQTALQELPPQKADSTAEQIMHAMVARENLARMLAKTSIVSPTLLKQIADLDLQFRSNNTRSRITELVKPSMLKAWRQTVQAPISAWWWALEDPATDIVEPPNPLWTILTVIFLALSIILLADLVRRLLGTGQEWPVTLVGGLVAAFQALITFLTGSSLLQIGPKWVEDFLVWLGIPKQFHHRWLFGIAFSMLLVVAPLYRFGPYLLALSFNNMGYQHQQVREIKQAKAFYELAIRFEPDFAPAHYNLAYLYEQDEEYDKAVSEYRAAIAADPTAYYAYNNLAYLHMARYKHFGEALKRLNIALEKIHRSDRPPPDILRYSLLKNRGWAKLELNDPLEAEVDLKQALELPLRSESEKVAAHCLRAQVWESKRRKNPQAVTPKDMLEECQACLVYGESSEMVEKAWLSHARECVEKGGAQ
jgi:tetratricopeptide (TPR) repeat protein